ncbi:MAG: nucleotidyl transferase AbiEii/AbiGii toxin family protein [Planctomycetota bacterium]|jgi:predicted nucleotidyltransferase component of viral defense system
MKQLEDVKKLAIVAMVSDDELMEELVLKGGNALDIIYKVGARASIDLDYSIEERLEPARLQEMKAKMEKSLRRVFGEAGYEVFDIKLLQRPPEGCRTHAPAFWGGYDLEFKIVARALYEQHRGDMERLRRSAEIVGPANRRTFKVQISECEFCRPKRAEDLEGYTLYVYSPEMIVIEKLRAICQQTEEYCATIGKSHREGRARDFFDIHTVLKRLDVDLSREENIQLVKDIFAAKRVPLELLTKIGAYREQHRADFPAVEHTVKSGFRLRSFDFYFDEVVAVGKALSEALGDV